MAMMMSRNGCSGGADEYAASRVPPGTVRESPPELLAVRGSFEEASDATIASLREHGGAVWDGCISAEALAEAREGLAGVMDACRAGFDAETDKLAVRFRDFGIVRVPMVGTGKKNIHFDPHGSPCFAAMAALAHAGRFEDLLKKYWGRPCSLSESGLSVTRPGGEGMEWHADGTDGEATVLVSLADVSADLGCLGMIPGSHAEYNPDKDGECLSDDARGAAAASRALWYPYRAGVPCIFDARTLHCAADNTNTGPSGFRFVLWYIYNAAEAKEEGEEGEEEEA